MKNMKQLLKNLMTEESGQDAAQHFVPVEISPLPRNDQ